MPNYQRNRLQIELIPIHHDLTRYRMARVGGELQHERMGKVDSEHLMARVTGMSPVSDLSGRI